MMAWMSAEENKPLRCADLNVCLTAVKSGLKKINKQKFFTKGVPVWAWWVKNMTSTHDDEGLKPGCSQWVKDPAYQ